MNNWYELETQFLDLAFRQAEVGLALSARNAGEDWYLQGGSSSARQELTGLCRRAGQCLFDVHLSDHETGSAIEPEIRWYRLLKERNALGSQGAARISATANPELLWSMDELAAHSAALCKALDRSVSDQKNIGWFIKQLKQNTAKTLFTTLCSLLTLLILGYLLYKNG